MVQALQMPDLEAQRVAMMKLDFLIGNWSGKASLLRPGGQIIQLAMTEEARYQLGGLILTIEGTGMSEDRVVLQAFGILNYDDLNRTYRMRAYNDGRLLDSDVKLAEHGEGIAWGQNRQ